MGACVFIVVSAILFLAQRHHPKLYPLNPLAKKHKNTYTLLQMCKKMRDLTGSVKSLVIFLLHEQRLNKTNTKTRYFFIGSNKIRIAFF